jgi:hypothetical protein
VALEDEVETDLEDGLLGGARVGAREGVPGGGELVEEAAGDRHAHAGALGIQGLHVGAVERWRPSRGRDGGGRRRFHRAHFGRPKLERLGVGCDRRGLGRGAGPHLRDHEVAARRVLDRADGGGDEGGVSARQAEEPGQHLARVLGRQDLRELDDRGEAQIASPERRLDLRVSLDELGRGLPVLRGSGRQFQFPPEELEQAPVPQRLPPTPAIEVREGDEEVRHRRVLAAEEVGEVGRLFACGRHPRSISRAVEASWNGRNRLLSRNLEERSRTPPAPPRRCPGASLARTEAAPLAIATARR